MNTTSTSVFKNQAERIELQGQISTIQQKLRETESRAEKWLDLTEKTFNFACYAHTHFNNGDLLTKKEVLMALGKNFLLKDQKLHIVPNEWLKPIIESYPAIEKQFQTVRTRKYSSPARQKEAFASLRPIVRGRPDLNRQPFP